MNREAAIEPLLREGRNFVYMIQKALEGRDTPLPYDALRLFGRFQVELRYGRSSPACLSERMGGYEVQGAVSPVQFGHPHYGGLMRYETTFDLAEPPGRLALRLEHLYETAEVEVNGCRAGILWKAPWLLELDPACLQRGRNRLALICSTSPANYLQGLQRPGGVLGKIELCRAFQDC